MKTQVVLGSLFGDEGKGACTQYLVKNALSKNEKPLVVRFSGGAQSAHTIKKGRMTHICSSFGAGVLEGIPTLYIGGYFDPISFVEECIALEDMGVEIPDIYLSHNVTFVTPYDVFANQESDREKTDGTCGKGIFQTFKRRNKGIHLDYFACTNQPDNAILEVASYYQTVNHMRSAMFKEAINNAYFQQHVHHTMEFDTSDYDVAIIEGTQGMLLDMSFGRYPNVTPSYTGLFGVHQAMQRNKWTELTLENAEVYFCCRSYLTRHGNGYEPTPGHGHWIRPNNYETNVDNQWQGNFKVGMFDIRLLNESFLRHNVDNMIKLYNLKPHLVMSCIDCIDRSWWYIDHKGFIRTCPNTPKIMQDIESIFKTQGSIIDSTWKFLFFANPYSNPFEE